MNQSIGSRLCHGGIRSLDVNSIVLVGRFAWDPNFRWQLGPYPPHSRNETDAEFGEDFSGFQVASRKLSQIETKIRIS